MRLARERLLLRRRPRGQTALAAVEADAGDVDVVDHRLVVDVGDVHVAEVVIGAIVVERAAVPETADVADADITEAVIDAAVEADMRTPIAAVPDINAVGPTPITRRPQETNPRRPYPGARHPVVA